MEGIVIENSGVIDPVAHPEALSDTARILIPLYATYMLLALCTFFVFIPQLEKHMMIEKKQAIRQLTDSVVSLLAEYESRVRKGELSPGRARQEAVDQIRTLRYGPQGKDYFWINDMHPIMIMHPYRPDLEGMDLSSFSDPQGNYPFTAMVRTVTKNDNGYVNYFWQWKDSPEKVVPKMSYVRRFAPWDWIIGTGVYVEDIQDEINVITGKLLQIFSGVLVFVILLSVYISRQVFRIDRKKKQAQNAHQLEVIRMKTLFELSRMGEQPLDAITGFALENAIALTRSRIGFLAFLNDDETRLTMHTWSKEAMAQCDIRDKTLVYHIDDTGLWARPVRTRKPEIVNDYDGFQSEGKKGCPEGHVGIRRLLSVPVFDQEKIVALAGVGNKAGRYDDSDVRQLQLMFDGMWKIIRKKQAEEELRQSEERYRLLAENATDAIWIMRLSDLKCIYASPAIETFLGYPVDEFLELDLSTYLTGNSLETATRMIAEELEIEKQEDADKNRLRTLELEMTGKDGTGIWAEITARFLRTPEGTADRIIGITRDISERKSMEQRIRQSQKMEALGTLAGGIAHDFNNILSSIIGFTELARLDLMDNDTVARHLDQVMTAGIRARDLVNHILTFSRKADIQKTGLEIIPLVKECLKFLKASIPPTIEIHRKMPDKNPCVLADPTQMHQLIMNLLTNAAYAMKDRGGVLTVQVKSVDIFENDIIQSKEIAPGRYVQLIITDTGCGIPRHLMGKIFEPFFTTKKRGEGTGMGLSTVYGIVREMDGDISVYSEPDLGTTVHILFPEMIPDEDTAGAAEAVMIKGNGHILVVDDESAIVSWVSQILLKLGYEVTGLLDSAEGADCFARDPGSFDLVLTDLAMPKMSGLELADRIKSIRPDIPVILCTGFSEGLTPETVAAHKIDQMIMKPMIASELSQAIHRAMTGTSAVHS